MRVTHINSFLEGGAGIASFLLHQTLSEKKLESSFLSGQQNRLGEGYCNCFTIGLQKRSALQKAKIRLQVAIESFRKIPGLSISQSKLERVINSLRSDLSGHNVSFPWSSYRLHTHPLVKQVDLIHLHWVSSVLDFPSFFSHINRPLVWTLHDRYPYQGLFHFREDVELFPPLVQQADAAIRKIKKQAYHSLRCPMHIVTPSQWMKDEVIKSDLLGSFPVSVIPNAVNGIFLQSRNKQEVRGKLGWSEDDVYLLFVAADVNEHIKGFHFLLEAIKSMTNMPKLIVVGRGYEIFSKQGTVVEFVGPKSPEEIATYYAGADAVTIPSLEDNLPGVMLEALASGTPVIGTPVGGLKEHIRDFETGILAKDVSGSAIAEAINAFMLERHQFDEEYIRGYGARFNAEEQASAYLSIYDQLLQGAKQGVI